MSYEEACAFQNDLNAQVAPRKLFRLSVGQNLNFLAVYLEETVMHFNVTVESALSCIIFQQMSQLLRVSQVVDCNNFDSFYFLNATECQTADTSKTVNAHFNTH
ncbi:hypothetical protein D3C75_821210 [compost metagenome]